MSLKSLSRICEEPRFHFHPTALMCLFIILMCLFIIHPLLNITLYLISWVFTIHSSVSCLTQTVWQSVLWLWEKTAYCHNVAIKTSVSACLLSVSIPTVVPKEWINFIKTTHVHPQNMVLKLSLLRNQYMLSICFACLGHTLINISMLYRFKF